MITYGHEKFIDQAINGVLMQVTDFEIELIIANDCSPDNTDKVVSKIIKNHPKGYLIKYTKHKSNLGMMRNFVWALEQCKAKYIAICDGDDYWTDHCKLQKQVNFLEANDDYVIHSGNARILSNDTNNDSLILNFNKDSVFEIDDFYKNNNVITCTVLFRNQHFIFPNFFDKIAFGDWFLYIILMNNAKKKVYRTNEVLSVYRIHSGGVMSNLNLEKNYLAHIYQIKSIQKYIGNKYYSKEIEQKLNHYYLEIFLLRCYQANYKKAILILFENLKSCFKSFPVKSYLSFLKIFILKKISI